MRKVVVIDTSILCVWLQVPGKSTCGSGQSVWTHPKVELFVQSEIQKQATLVLPLAAIIETGNHISQAPTDRYEAAMRLAELMTLSADGRTPWAAFVNESKLWDPEGLRRLSAEWPALAATKLSLGDAAIKRVAEYYAQIGYSVELFTGDKGLKAYQPIVQPKQPRRRQK